MIYVKFLQTNPIDQQNENSFSDIIKAELDFHNKGYKNYHLMLLSGDDRTMLQDSFFNNDGRLSNSEILADIVIKRLIKEIKYLPKDNENFGILIVSPRYMYTPMNLYKNTLDRFLNRLKSNLKEIVVNNSIFVEE